MNDSQERRDYARGYARGLWGSATCKGGEWCQLGFLHGLRASRNYDGLRASDAMELAEDKASAYFHAAELTTVPNY